jgi:hypothetical protein
VEALLARPHDFFGPLFRHAFIKRVVAHHHRRGAAACQALDKFNRVFAVSSGLRTVRL